jgi:hypothetical protein
MSDHVLHFTPDGSAAGLYTEAIDLNSIGRLEITRASSVEFNDDTQQWEVFDYLGVRQFSHRSRQACLDWERQSFNQPNPDTTPKPMTTD